MDLGFLYSSVNHSVRSNLLNSKKKYLDLERRNRKSRGKYENLVPSVTIGLDKEEDIIE